MVDSDRFEKLSNFGGIASVALGLYLSSRYSYLLFHSLVEITTIAIAFALFILTWNTREYLGDIFLRLLGIGYGFIALIDLLHTLSYKGMNIFPGFGANLPTQLWIAARYLQAATLIGVPLLVERKVDNRGIFAGFGVAVTALTVMVYSGNFPDCFIEGKGLTAFKIISEYLICALLCVALYLLFRQRRHFSGRTFRLIASSIACTIISELSFTAYVNVYGFANLLGHFAKLAAFYLVYRAILVTGFKDPFDLIFRELKQAEESLRQTQDKLEATVAERTAELRASEIKFRSLIDKVQTAIVLHDGQGLLISCNPLALELLGLSADQLLDKALIDPDWHFLRQDGSVMPVTEYPVSRVLATQSPLRGYVTGISRPDQDKIIWVLVNAEPEYDEAGTIVQVIVSFVDITERKLMEDALSFIAQRGWLAGADNFFDALAHFLGDCFEVDYVVIDELDEDSDMAVTRALYAKGEIVPNMRYALKGTPCENVVGRQLCVYSRGVQQLFPEDTLLADMDVESYIGIPLWDSLAQPIGLIALMDSQPFQNETSAATLLQLVATRAAAELERARSDRILRKSEQEFRTLAENSPDNIARYDVNCRTVYMNPAMEKTLGCPASEKLGKTPLEVPRINTVRVYQEKISEVLASGEASEMDLVMPDQGQGGRYHNIRFVVERQEDGAISGVLVLGRDITERKQAEKEIHLLNQELERRVTERTAELESRSVELKDSQRALMNMVEDLNEKTAELEQANSKLKEVDQLKSMFIASMSHELRTPLNSIIGFSSILMNEWTGPLNPEQKENLEAVLRSGKHLLSLINDVIDVSKIETGKIESFAETFDIHDLVREAVETVKKDIHQKRLELVVNMPHQILHTDRRRLLQCLLNLLSNATKFTMEGSIDVSAEPSSDGSMMTITVEDTGIGISEEDLENLFSPFVRLHATGETVIPGTGLGLYLTQKLLKDILHGDILVMSNYGTGSRFTIRVPINV